jgi:hypothetical protein
MAHRLLALLVFTAAAVVPARVLAQTTDPPIPPPTPDVQEEKSRRNFLLPIVEIVIMDTGINLVGRQMPDGPLYKVSLSSIRKNLRSSWVIDDDPFEINQFLHPYQGAMYHGIARSSGMNYWQSAIYSFAGSALWEIAGETTAPSFNDQIASGIGGPFFGEPLFRLSEALLHGMSGTRGSPGFWRGLGATVLSPPNGINHAVFGERYHAAASSHKGATDLRLHLGVGGISSTTARESAPLTLNSGQFGVSIDYGLPGRADYAHERPFDYFTMEAMVSGALGVETVATRGLIAGKDYNSERVAGVWGLYGHYDYLASDAFRFSTTAMSLGTSTQFWLSEAAALQTTLLGGVGFSAAQTVRGTEEEDYHFGIAPQGLVAAKLIGGRRLAVDLSGRDYYVSGVGGFTRGAHDRVRRGDASVALRLFGRHAVSVNFRTSRRTAFIPGLPEVAQRSDTVGVFYNLLGAGGFGAIR